VENSGNIDKLTSCPVIYVWHDLLILESKAGFETPKMPFVEVTNPFATGMIYYCPALPFHSHGSMAVLQNSHLCSWTLYVRVHAAVSVQDCPRSEKENPSCQYGTSCYW